MRFGQRRCSRRQLMTMAGGSVALALWLPAETIPIRPDSNSSMSGTSGDSGTGFVDVR